MKKSNLYILTFILFIPFFVVGQIPKGHFIDADDSVEKGYKLKPFKQKKAGIYHYAILTELPFENNCKKGLTQKERINCSEETLKKLISNQITSKFEFKGEVYVYLTVNKSSQIQNIKVKSYPQSNLIDKLFKEATEKIKVKPAEYKKKTVKSRLWTSFKFE